MNHTSISVGVGGFQSAHHHSDIRRSTISGQNAYFIPFQPEMRHVCRAFGHDKGVIWFIGDHLVVFCPIDKFVAFVGDGSQRAFVAIVVSAPTFHHTAFCWVSDRINRVFLRSEIRHQSTISGHDKAEYRRSVGNGVPLSFRPVHEAVALVRRGGKGTSVAFGNASAACCRAAFFGLPRNRYGVISGVLAWRRRFQCREGSPAFLKLKPLELVPHHIAVIIRCVRSQRVDVGDKTGFGLVCRQAKQVTHVVVPAQFHAGLELARHVDNIPFKRGAMLPRCHLYYFHLRLFGGRVRVLLATDHSYQHQQKCYNCIRFFHISV